jgi:hypothetical protein
VKRVIAIAIAFGATAHADSDAYPTRLVDRPLVVPDEIAEADVALDAPSEGDQMIGLLDELVATASATRGMDGFAPSAGASVLVREPAGADADRFAGFFGAVDAALGAHAKLGVLARAVHPADNTDNGYDLRLDGAGKERVLPWLAVVADGGISYAHRHTANPFPGFPDTISALTVAFAGAAVQAQPTDRLGVAAQIDLLVPLRHSDDLMPTVSGAASLTFLYAFGRVDALVRLHVMDLGRADDPELVVGAAARF